MPSSQGTGATGKGKTPSSAAEPVGLTVAASATATAAKRARKAETVREAEPLKETGAGRSCWEDLIVVNNGS